MSSTRTAPGRVLPGGPTPSGRSARAPPDVKSQKPPQMLAVGGTRCDRCSESGPRRGGRSNGQSGRASANRRRSSRGERARGRRRGLRRHCPKRPGGKANILRRRPLARVNECIKTVRDPSRSRGRGGCGGCVCVCVWQMAAHFAAARGLFRPGAQPHLPPQNMRPPGCRATSRGAMRRSGVSAD